MDEDFLTRIPTSPGVYLMKDKKGRVIYVGKAKDLRARVRSYFRGGDERPFVVLGHLGRLIGDIETVVVNNEKEALLLENNLIKQHQPRFNVKLTDDKNYLVLRIDPKKTWPRVEVGRRIADDGAKYFGPYHSATSARETLRVINRHFQLRTCTDHVLANRARPCILHQIKRCPAPCVLPVSPEAYADQVEDACLFLSGRKDELLPRLRERMKEAAGRQAYEHAAQLRDQIQAVEKTLIRQTVVSTDIVDQDVVGIYRQGDVVEVAVLFMRAGKLIGRRTFQIKDQELPDPDVVRDFVRGYYDLGSFIPDEVLLPVEIEDQDAFAEWLTGTRGRRVEVRTPQRGAKAKLIELAEKNAEASSAARKGKQGDVHTALEKLQTRLGLLRFPRRIECFDVAHIQGAQTVASMVVFEAGEPARAAYRTFKVKSVANDDFAAMYEVLARRFRRARAAIEGIDPDENEWAEPDLLVVDGGKGQLGSAMAALRDVAWPTTGEHVFDLVALAKDPDRVFLKNIKDPMVLRENSTELFMLARVRDEAHRFANEFHQRQRKKRTIRSLLEEIPGVGPKRRRELLKHFGSLKKIRAASVDEIAGAPGMTRSAAEAVKRVLGEAPP
ncbi:MAG TPA: excinuclease ABC subunit UvrC [Haliangiales bacterium]|nr:excinuclease ABC subunit UvrC [Haliangiales bacterium]